MLSKAFDIVSPDAVQAQPIKVEVAKDGKNVPKNIESQKGNNELSCDCFKKLVEGGVDTRCRDEQVKAEYHKDRLVDNVLQLYESFFPRLVD